MPKSYYEPRYRRPYEKKTISRGGLLIFGLGLGAAAAIMLILVGLMLPNFSRRLENLPYYARTYYRKLIPHPECEIDVMIGRQQPTQLHAVGL